MSEQPVRYVVGASDGVSYQDVLEASYDILRKGMRPSVRNVRDKIGHGSPNIINKMLQRFWYELVPPAQHIPAAHKTYSIPSEVLDHTHRIWEILRRASKEEFTRQLSKQEQETGEQQIVLNARLEAITLRERALQDDYNALVEKLGERTEQLSQRTAEFVACKERAETAEEKYRRASRQYDEQLEVIHNLRSQIRRLLAGSTRGTRNSAIEPRTSTKPGGVKSKSGAAKSRNGRKQRRK